MKYGKIDNGILRVVDLQPRQEPYQTVNDKGIPIYKVRTIPIEEVIEEAKSQGLKPVAEIDMSIVDNVEEGYIMEVVPVDLGDSIGYQYNKVIDKTKIKYEIRNLKAQLTSTDYQVIKCYEASLTGTEMPYDIETLVASRQAARIRINELEATL